jgi:hypothetical protein
MFHASADLELEPPDTTGDTYNVAQYENYLQSNVDDGGLTTWLIEEVEWSGRPCQNDDRLGTCNGGSNRENNTVYLPRWNGWMQLLDFVKNYPGGVAMTMGDVALAKGYDNAPTVSNAGQADADHDGIGDPVDGASLDTPDVTMTRNLPGTLTATLTNGAGDPIAGQELEFSFDADGDATPEQQTATTNASGIASVGVTATRPAGGTTYTASWDGGHGMTASGTGNVTVLDQGHVRPRGATPFRMPLVPAYTECTSPNTQHGAPLDSPSCTPPQPASGHLTTGTPDANGKSAQSSGHLLLRVHAGDEATPADESDADLTISLTDVRNAGDLSDYTGELEAITSLRLTDRYSGDSLDSPATLEDTPFAVTVPCGGTPEERGATCAVSTSMDALIPGLAPEGTRAVWQLGKLEVYDGGADGLASTDDNSLFAVQGIFIP